MQRTIVLVLTLAACSTDEAGWPNNGSNDELTTYTSGTRLRVRYGSSPDGARMFLGWYDNERKENCIVYQVGQGKMKCLPQDSVQTSVYFEDAACVHPLAIRTKCGTAVPRYVVKVTVPNGQCGTETTYSVFSTKMEVVPTQLFQLVGTNCTITSASPALQYYAPSTEIPVMSFVEMTERIE